jgi:hypothetical protein
MLGREEAGHLFPMAYRLIVAPERRRSAYFDPGSAVEITQTASY